MISLTIIIEKTGADKPLFFAERYVDERFPVVVSDKFYTTIQQAVDAIKAANIEIDTPYRRFG